MIIDSLIPGKLMCLKLNLDFDLGFELDLDLDLNWILIWIWNWVGFGFEIEFEFEIGWAEFEFKVEFGLDLILNSIVFKFEIEYELGPACWNVKFDAAGCKYVFAFEAQAFLFEKNVFFFCRFYKSDPGPSNSARARNLRSNA